MQCNTASKLLKAYAIWIQTERHCRRLHKNTDEYRYENLLICKIAIYDKNNYKADVNYCPLCTIYFNGTNCKGCPLKKQPQSRCGKLYTDMSTAYMIKKQFYKVSIYAGDIATKIRDRYEAYYKTKNTKK